ncbi:uncharacterized protein LOC107611698 [Arachis ipaensis]|uniref:uncharacterized protein LOC107611698 n=1 Tax=Arachis ipaensis TaxID=130454 RepID=UPI0007AF2F89|nr:uncharacterized protein LOC107611698 [Arachis ipaensis]
MASDENFVVLVHYRGSIKKNTRSGIKFTDKDPLSVFLKPSMTFAEFKDTTLQKLGLLGVKRVEKLFYRIPISILRDDVKYDSFVIGSDNDLQVLHHCLSCSRSIPVSVSSIAPIIAPEAVLVASPSFALNLNRSDNAGVGETRPLGEVAFATLGSPTTIPVFGEIGVPNGVEDALHDDDDDDDVESATIADDSDDDTPRSTPAADGGASSSALGLDAMAPQGDPGVPIGFEARETQNTGVVSKFQVGQEFQDKEEVVLNMRTYSIRLGLSTRY